MLIIAPEGTQCSKKSFMPQKHCFSLTFRPEKRKGNVHKDGIYKLNQNQSWNLITFLENDPEEKKKKKKKRTRLGKTR
jgi:hypothetical protein